VSRVRVLRLPRHEATTANLAAVYPFHADAGLGPRGLYLGTDLLSGGAFCFDPFELYSAGVLTSPNLLVLGDLGSGKSAATKCFLARSIGVLGRWVAIVDPKGEYGPLAERFGLGRVQLHPGGSCRLNPLDAGSADTNGHDVAVRRTTLAVALLATVARRDLTPVEEAAVGFAVDELGEAGRPAPTLADLAALLAAPTEAMARRADLPIVELTSRLEHLRFAAGKLLDGHLRGMFHGPSTTRIDGTGPGVVVDVSAVFHDREALAVVMLAVTGWLNAVLAAPAPGSAPRRIQVIDECWALLGDVRVARYFQACWKLSRAYGVANVAIAHRIADLRAQADDGTTAAKVAEGLLADAQTRVLFRQPADQLEDARRLLALTEPESRLVAQLGRGRALWRVGSRAAVVQHVIGAEERDLCDTDIRLVV
jgi:type IV secretory pathway VirB4 component